VSEVLVRGATVRRENGVLVVEGDPDEWRGDPWERGFAMVNAGPWVWESGRHGDRRRARWERNDERTEARFGPRPRRGRPVPPFIPVEIRANPDLDLTLDVTAGNARVSGMHGKIECSLTAASTVLTDVRGPLDCSVTAGSLAVDGPLSRGDSRIRCDMGSVKVRLSPGADVRISIDSSMGRPDVQIAGWAGRGEEGEWIVGDGTASLAIVASMASVKIREAS
jgi:hypothetical protein